MIFMLIFPFYRMFDSSVHVVILLFISKIFSDSNPFNILHVFLYDKK